MSLRSFWLMKSDFPLSNNISKMNITIIWLETPSNYHQSLHIIFWWLKNIFRHNWNVMEAHKWMNLRSFQLLKNDFPSSNHILKSEFNDGLAAKNKPNIASHSIHWFLVNLRPQANKYPPGQIYFFDYGCFSIHCNNYHGELMDMFITR